MDKIWDRKSFEVGGQWPLWRGWKNPMTMQNRQKSNCLCLACITISLFIAECILEKLITIVCYFLHPLLLLFFQQRRKLRIFISNTFYPAKPAEGDDGEESMPSWELRVEGRLLEDVRILLYR